MSSTISTPTAGTPVTGTAAGRIVAADERRTTARLLAAGVAAGPLFGTAALARASRSA